jgi:basic membrane protein A and related proteins
MDRRSFLRSSLVASGAFAIPSLARAATYSASNPLKIGFCYSGPIGGGGWTYQHELGRLQVEKTFGDKVKTVYVENVPETADAERVIRQFVQQGCDLIFTTSFGFMEPTIRVAKQFPKVMFEHATGYKMAPNVGIYQTRFYEGAYLLGILAGKMTKSNALGYVGSYPIPEVIRNCDAFTLGARSVNPKVQTRVIWLQTWYDPGRERAAAEALVGQGCDVMYQNTDSPAIVQVAQEKHLYAFGQDSDMLKYGPNSQLSANTVDWGVYYVKKIRDVLDGKWKAEDTKWGMKEGMIVLTPLNAAVPADVAKLFNERQAALLSGSLLPFAGPIKDNDGNVKVGAGKALPEAELWSMNWYVDGVMGKLPT